MKTAPEFDPIVNAVAIKIGTERVRLRGTRGQQRGEATKRSQNEPPRCESPRVDRVVAVQGPYDRMTSTSPI